MRKPRRPSIKTMIEQAKQAGRPLANIVLADGTTLNFAKPGDAEDEGAQGWEDATAKLQKEKRL
jgi:hypothetical protein